MDYILFGAGTGASLAVIGWILREWGPRLRDGKADDGVIHSASELIDRMSWARFCASCGMAMVIAGTMVLLATAIVAAWNPGDQLASRILIGTYVVMTVLMLVWAFLYTRQFGTSGIYRPVLEKPVSDTQEAVATVETTPKDGDTIETDSDDSTSPAPERDFAEVAASRGGLGRFASFFNRPRSTEAADDEFEQVAEFEEVDVSVGAGNGDREENLDVVEDDTTMVAVADVVETEQIVQIGDVAGDTADNQDLSVDDDTSSDPEPASADAEPPVEKPAAELSPAASAAPATPEDEALAELRRRRLARLSGSTE